KSKGAVSFWMYAKMISSLVPASASRTTSAAAGDTAGAAGWLGAATTVGAGPVATGVGGGGVGCSCAHPLVTSAAKVAASSTSIEVVFISVQFSPSLAVRPVHYPFIQLANQRAFCSAGTDQTSTKPATF